MLIGATHCLDDCALTLTMALKRAQPEETLLRIHCSETRQPDQLEEHEKCSDCRCDKKLLDLAPSDSMTKCPDLRHCVVRPAHAVAASLA